MLSTLRVSVGALVLGAIWIGGLSLSASPAPDPEPPKKEEPKKDERTLEQKVEAAIKSVNDILGPQDSIVIRGPQGTVNYRKQTGVRITPPKAATGQPVPGSVTPGNPLPPKKGVKRSDPPVVVPAALPKLQPVLPDTLPLPEPMPNQPEELDSTPADKIY
jgi:hypothetical protein